MLDNIKIFLGCCISGFILIIGVFIHVFIELCITPKGEKFKQTRPF